MDREHERDFFQQEIQKLEEQLKNPLKLQSGSEQRNQEVTGESSVFLPEEQPVKEICTKHCCGCSTGLIVTQQNNVHLVQLP